MRVLKLNSAAVGCARLALMLAFAPVATSAADPTLAQPVGGFEARFGRFDGTGLTGSLKEFVAGGWFVRAWQQIEIRHWNVAAEVKRVASLTRVRYADGDDQFGFAPPAAVNSLTLQVSPPWRVVTAVVGVQAPDGGVSTPGVTLGLWLQPVHSLGLGFESSAPPRWPTPWTAAFEGEGGTVAWAASCKRSHWRTEFSPGESWRLLGHLEDLRLVPGEPDEHAAGEYAMHPAGLLLRRSLEITKLFQEGRLRLGLGLANGDFSGSLYGYTEGLRFGQLGILEATWENWSFTVSQNSPGAEWTGLVSGGSGELYSAGVVKFWPFSDGLVSLLGSRRHLEISGDARWWHAAGHINKHIGSVLEVGAGLDWYRVYPNLQTFSWQPLIFGIGVADPKLERLPIERIDLGMVSFSSLVRLNRNLQLTGALRQWLPLGTQEFPAEPVAQGPPSSAPAPTGRPTGFGTGLAVSAGIALAW